MKAQYYVFLFFGSLFFLGSCVSSKFIGKDEYYIDQNKITGAKEISVDEYKTFISQKPNRKLPLIGTKLYVYLYWLGSRSYDTAKVEKEIKQNTAYYKRKLSRIDSTSNRYKKVEKKRDKKLEKLNTKLEEGNWIMRTMGEKPALFDEVIAEKTKKQLGLFLQSKGYFHGNVKYRTDTMPGRNIVVNYIITENRPHKLRNITIKSLDPQLDSLINAAKSESKLKAGDNFEEAQLKDERERYYNLFRDNGYYDFLRQYVFVEADTSALPYAADVDLIITNPANQMRHVKYRIGEILFVIDKANMQMQPKRTIIYDSKTFQSFAKRYSPKILNSKITIEKGDYYSMSGATLTMSQINSLDIFSFATINFKKESDSVLSVLIATGSTKKYQISNEVGLSVSEGIPGPALSVTFTDRNIFHSCEIFDASGYYNITGQQGISTQGIYRSTEYGGRMGLTFPQILIPGKVKYIFNPYRPKTKISTNFGLTDRPEYARSVGNLAFQYNIRRRNTQFFFYPADYYLLNTTRIDPLFQATLDSNANLKSSFNQSVITSIVGGFTYNNFDSQVNKRAQYCRMAAELGGMLPWALNHLTSGSNTATADDKLFGLQYYRYVRLSADLRYYYPISKKTTAVTRLNFGIVKPMFDTEAVPYEKYYFAGGVSSLRAWSPRRLGPGGFATYNSDGTVKYNYEKPGNILMEANLEYRFNFIKFIKLAFFFDAGNVWGLNYSQYDEKAKFKIDMFYKQIALNTGGGVRFDFNFLILRMDVGVKILDPALPDGKYVVFQPDFWKKSSLYAINFGLGYPF